MGNNNAKGRVPALSPRTSFNSFNIRKSKSGKNKKIQNGKSLLSAPFTNECGEGIRLNECESVRRLIMVLDWYENMRNLHCNMEMDKLLIEYVDTYTNLLNDYQHILFQHLNQDKATNDENFLFIYNKLSKYMQCDVKSCKQYIRIIINNPISPYNSSDGKYNSFVDNDNDSIDTMDASDNRNVVDFYIELLDVIHCYFMHSFDVGLRLNTNLLDLNEEEIIEFDGGDITNDDDDDDDGMVLLHQDLIIMDHMEAMETKDESLIDFNHQNNNNILNNHHNHDVSITNTNTDNNKSDIYDDEEMSSLENLLRSKRDTFKTMRGFSLIQHSKFFEDISCRVDMDDEKKGNDAYDAIMAINNEDYVYEYSFGNRFYFWSWYKDNENEDVFWNPGKKYRDLYITKKYKHLKEEIIENKIYRIGIDEYDRTVGKATMYQEKSDVINTIRSSNKNYGGCHYGIDNNEVLRIEHIMSIMLYTDHQHLSMEFTRNFARRSTKETDDEYKKKKSEYANWNRLIRETVELYGTTMEQNKIKTFYTGYSSQIIFNKFRVKMACPISTSPQISVIMMFGQSDGGIILDLGQSAQSGNKLKCFNCSLFSCYGEEDERLFCGGYAPIQINSIRIIKSQKNYQPFLVSLGYFDTILNGAYDINNKCTTSDFKTINNLMKQLMASEDIDVINDIDDIKADNDNNNNDDMDIDTFPIYISEMFKQFVFRKESIYIDLQGLNWHYKSFISLLISPKCNNLVRFSFIATLFRNCSNITVKMLMYDSVSKSYIAALLEDIDRINTLSTSHSLKTIKLELIRVNVNQTKWKEFESAMNALNCKLKLTGKGHEGYKELLIVFDEKKNHNISK